MRTLRLLCFASLFALILLCGTADSAGSVGLAAPEKPPTNEQAAPSSSGTITITMTGIVGDPGDIGVR
jgi:hypothetical protein